ncbi:hypothetical protein EYB26_008176 [Talaromyces marneffei]|uniref:uncharacterized protein n=1 Tax=Talaromyces marneffei TaxID=37727 RepID=UPI0012AA21F9|nr:uncharacterized protein EYB26_008176 [Talaromyces marneffei]QGA20472.1 hypothetical protein EYB26_008176 [Talaromyces marneffei]
MVPTSRDGLTWDESGFELRPAWTREPSLEAITNVCREKLRIEKSEACDVSFYAAGAFNKLYLIQMNHQQLLIRVSLPVHPQKQDPGRSHDATGNHFDYDVARGPFRSTYDWLASYLEIIIKDQTTAKEEAEDEEDEEDAAFALALAHRLADLLPKIFPSLQNPPEQSVIWHEDMSLSNILINEQGEITPLLDWECVSAMPPWMATAVPKFLQGSVREEEPKRQDYADETENEPETPVDGEDDDLDNEGKNELYWIHLMEYEKTQLRRLYQAQMCKSRPGWDSEIKQNSLKEDFIGAVFRCGHGFSLKRIVQWVDAIDKGQFPRLKDVLEAGLRP